MPLAIPKPDEAHYIPTAVTTHEPAVTRPHLLGRQVAEVFVRINSEGKQLNQSDFILTLMSVFWDEGRAELEEFCREARKPSPGRPSPFNLNRFIGH